MNAELAESFPPGDYLAEELAERHWSQSDFAEILGRPTQFVSEIISGKKEITRESAAQIGAALGTSAELWLNLQNTFLLWRHEQDTGTQRELNAVKLRARLNELAPIAALRKRGLVTGSTLEEQADDVRRLFEITSLEDEPAFLAAARRANPDAPLTPTQLAWLACTRQRARGLQAERYDKAALTTLAEGLSRKVRDPDGFLSLPAAFADVGVRLTYLEALPSSRMNGASFLLDDDADQPVVALSGRGHRLDIVVFTLLHEVAHLVRGDISPENPLIDEGTSHTLGDEAKADSLAAMWAVPGGLPFVPRPVRQPWVEQEADRRGVHPILIIGQLQKHGRLEWRTQLAKGAPTVTAQLERW